MRHMKLHERGWIKFRCRLCHEPVQCTSASRINHDNICRRLPPEADTRQRSKRVRSEGVCPKCNELLSGRSVAELFRHNSVCDGIPLQADEEDPSEAEPEMYDYDEDDHGQEHCHDHLDDVGPVPTWGDRFHQRSGYPVHLEDCDRMLLFGMEASGHRLPDGAWQTLYRILNSNAFSEAYSRGCLSTTYNKIKEAEKAVMKEMWKEVTFKAPYFTFEI